MNISFDFAIFLTSMYLSYLITKHYTKPHIIIKYPNIKLKHDIYLDDRGVCYKYKFIKE